MIKETKYCVIMASCPSKEEALTIARSLVSDKLSACVQIKAIESVYSWDGEIQEDSEYLLSAKTEKSLFGQVKSRVDSLHSYEVAEVICLDISDGSKEYLDWVSDMTKNSVN